MEPQTRESRLTELRQALKQTKDRRLYERYQAVLLHLEGHTAPEIGHIIGRNRKTVGIYLAAYRAGGLAGLGPLPHTGRPRRLSLGQEAELAEIVSTRLPSETGFEGRAKTGRWPSWLPTWSRNGAFPTRRRGCPSSCGVSASPGHVRPIPWQRPIPKSSVCSGRRPSRVLKKTPERRDRSPAVPG